MEALPQKVDVVVLGSGLPESMLAAAASRSGRTVLHLDRNDFYGGEWASFNLKTIEEWIQRSEESADTADCEEAAKLALEDEKFVAFGRRKCVRNVQNTWLSPSGAVISVSKKEETKDMTKREALEAEWRRFSIDLAPKVLMSCGSMVRTLCDSGVSKYAEFKCVNRFVSLGDDGAPVRVPCTKGEIFENEHLSLLEKRRLMKFLQFCLQWHTDSDSADGWKDFAEKPFSDFLNAQGITDSLQLFITDAIGILHPNANCQEGLDAVCRFIESVGRFGPSPFLFTLYGSGELPQCFCRLSAVFGGLYCLGRAVTGMIMKDEKIVAVIADGQRIDCEVVFMSNEYVPDVYVDRSKTEEWTTRATFVTDNSLWKEEGEHISLLNLVKFDRTSAPRMLEVGYDVCTAPKGYYLSHLTAAGTNVDMDSLFAHVYPEDSALWSLKFEVQTRLSVTLPDNVACVPGPDSSLDYNSAIKEVMELFKRFWPEDDFLPVALQTDDTEKVEEEST